MLCCDKLKLEQDQYTYYIPIFQDRRVQQHYVKLAISGKFLCFCFVLCLICKNGSAAAPCIEALTLCAQPDPNGAGPIELLAACAGGDEQPRTWSHAS